GAGDRVPTEEGRVVTRAGRDGAARCESGRRRQECEWGLEGAEVHCAIDDPWQAALVGGDPSGDGGIAAGVDGGTAGQEGHGLGGAVVIAERGQELIDGGGRGADLVAADAVADAGGADAV